jgi:hypothetical protein
MGFLTGLLRSGTMQKRLAITAAVLALGVAGCVPYVPSAPPVDGYPDGPDNHMPQTVCWNDAGEAMSQPEGPCPEGWTAPFPAP